MTCTSGIVVSQRYDSALIFMECMVRNIFANYHMHATKYMQTATFKMNFCSQNTAANFHSFLQADVSPFHFIIYNHRLLKKPTGINAQTHITHSNYNTERHVSQHASTSCSTIRSFKLNLNLSAWHRHNGKFPFHLTGDDQHFNNC